MENNNPVPGNDFGWPKNSLFQNYLELKAEAPTAILLVEMGAFFEIYGEDAVCAASILDLALTRRGSFLDGTPIPMCGIPADNRFVSSKDNDVQYIGSTMHFIKSLLKTGRAVAIAVCQPTTPITRKIEWLLWPSPRENEVSAKSLKIPTQ
jgi:hypothetical protein